MVAILGVSGQTASPRNRVDEAITLSAPDGAPLACRVAHGEPAFPALLLIHGMGSNMTRWSEFVHHTSLRPRFEIVRPDLRGHGDSIRRATLSMEVWCADLAAVLAARGQRHALVVGHSLGAVVALWLALLYPARVRGLVLVEPSFSAAMAGMTPSLRRLRWLFTAAARTVLALNRLGIHRRRLPGRDLWEWDRRARRDLLDAGRREDLVRLYRSVWVDLRYNATSAYLQDFVQLLRPLPPLDRIRAPSLTLLSSETSFADRQTTEAILSLLPDNRIETLPATHWIMTETPEAAREHIDRWCSAMSDLSKAATEPARP
jgi:pimeloyl-ACP methyl ester carboxylesterase